MGKLGVAVRIVGGEDESIRADEIDHVLYPSFVRFRAFRSKAEHDQFATCGTGASAVIPSLAARTGQVGIHSYFFEIGVLPRGGLSFWRTSAVVGRGRLK